MFLFLCLMDVIRQKHVWARKTVSLISAPGPEHRVRVPLVADRWSRFLQLCRPVEDRDFVQSSRNRNYPVRWNGCFWFQALGLDLRGAGFKETILRIWAVQIQVFRFLIKWDKNTKAVSVRPSQNASLPYVSNDGSNCFNCLWPIEPWLCIRYKV